MQECGVVKKIIGKNKRLTIWKHLIIGDIQGNNYLVGAYQNTGVWPYWACKCIWDDLNSKAIACNFVQLSEFQEQKNVLTGA